MCRYVFQIVAFKMDKSAALKAFQVEMVVTFFAARILIAGTFALAEDIFSYKVLFAELFKVAVDGGFTDLLGSQRIGYAVGGEVAVCVFFYIFEYQLALAGVV